MKMTKKGVGVFLLSLIIAFLLLGSVFMLFYRHIKTTGVSDNRKDILYSGTEDVYIPNKTESINMLIIGCDAINLPPKMMIVVTYDAVSGEIMLTPLPPNAVVTVGVREDTLAGHYDYEGIRGGVNAVKSLLVIDIDRYARIDKTGVANLIDFLGGIECEFQDDVICAESDGRIEKFTKGKQLLDGRRAVTLMFSESAQYDIIQKQGELSSLLLNQKMNSKLADRLSNLISAFFYNAETNLNQYDFAIRQKGFDAFLKDDKLKVILNNLNGDYGYNSNNDEVFLPDNESIRDLSDKLSRIYN